MPSCLAWVGCACQSPRVQPQQRLSHPSVTQQQAGVSRAPRGEPAHPTHLLQGLMLQHIGEAAQCHPLSPAGQPLLREGLAHLQQQQQHRLPGALQHPCRQNPGNTFSNPPLCSLKQAFIYAAAGEIYLRIYLKYTENNLSLQSTFSCVFLKALRLLSLCRANTAFAGIKLHLCKFLRMPS